MSDAQTIVARVKHMRQHCVERDRDMAQMKALREGNWAGCAPGLFPEDWPKPVVANLIDVAARDISSVIAALPTFECKSGTMVSARARTFAGKRTQIARGYVEESDLQNQFLTGVDRWITYGFLPVTVHPSPFMRVPQIQVEDPYGAYYALDSLGRRTVWYARCSRQPVYELYARFPEAHEALASEFPNPYDEKPVEIIRWQDDQESVLVTVQGNVVLSRVAQPLERCPVHIVELPHVGDKPRGQFDDVLYVQLAKARMALYQLQAADESVNAPTVAPDDVTDLPFGPGALISTKNPAGVGRVNLQIPPGIFTEAQILDGEIRSGARYPEGRSGNIDASIITGQGVEALMGNFTAQTKTGQLQLAQLLQDVIRDCFTLDEKLWPDLSKTITGKDHGARYEVTYTPSKDINGDYSCEVTYGLTAGLDPNRALVFLIQGKTTGLFSTDTVMRQLPLDIDVEGEKQKMDIETLETSLSNSLAATAQAIPQLVAQGQDPAAIVSMIANVIELRGKGKSMSDAVSAVFTPPAPPEGAASAEAGPGAGGGQQPPPGGPQIQSPGQGSELLMTLAGLSNSGNPNMQANISGMTPLGQTG